MKQSLLLFLIAFSTLAKSQINVIRLNEKDYESLKQTVTYFQIPDFDADKKQLYVDMLKSVWNFTTLKIVTQKEAEALKNDVSISKFVPVAMQVQEGPSVIYFFQYKMYMYYTSRKNEIIEKEIGCASFCLKHTAIGDLYDKKGDVNSQKQYIIKNNVAHNYSMGFLKNYFQWINTSLIKNDGRTTYLSKILDKEKLSKIGANDTLFIPDYISEYPQSDVTFALAKAKFKYKIIPVKALNDKILTSKEPFYYLNFVRFGYNKGINIVNSKDGNFIFNNWNDMGFSMKNLTLLDDDVKILNNALK